MPTAPRSSTPRGAEFQLSLPILNCLYAKYLFEAFALRTMLEDEPARGQRVESVYGIANRRMVARNRATVGSAKW